MLAETRSLLEAGNTRAQMIRAWSADAEHERDRAVIRHRRTAPRLARLWRLVTYGALGLAGVGIALIVVKPIPSTVGAVAMLAGVASAMFAAHAWFRVHRSRAEQRHHAR